MGANSHLKVPTKGVDFERNIPSKGVHLCSIAISLDWSPIAWIGPNSNLRPPSNLGQTPPFFWEFEHTEECATTMLHMELGGRGRRSSANTIQLASLGIEKGGGTPPQWS